jgi:hypothetical protein
MTVGCSSVPKVMCNSPPVCPEPVVDAALHHDVIASGPLKAWNTSFAVASTIRVFV